MKAVHVQSADCVLKASIVLKMKKSKELTPGLPFEKLQTHFSVFHHSSNDID